MKTYSLKFNDARKVWIAQVKNPLGKWTTKYLPRELTKGQESEAERWLITWMAEFFLTGTKEVSPKSLAPLSISFLADKWLDYRKNDPDTSPNSFNSLNNSMKNWILDGSREHRSIQDLDIETELTVHELRAWFESLKGSPASRLQRFLCLSTFFNDCIMLEWLDPNMTNPMNKPILSKMKKGLSKHIVQEKVITHLSLEQVQTLLTKHHAAIPAVRRTRYLCAIATGMRDMELQGLTWADVDFKAQTINVVRQLHQKGCAPILPFTKGMKEVPNALSRNPKRNSKRLLPLHPALRTALEALWKKEWRIYAGRSPKLSDPVFPRQNQKLKDNQQGGDFCMSHSSDVFNLDLQRLELPTEFEGKPIVFHSLRHTFSSLLESIGADEGQIGVLLGHASKTVVRGNYLGKNVELLRGLIDKLPLTIAETPVGPPRLALVKLSQAG